MERGKYWKVIIKWHEKAHKEQDDFIKFIVEYISFNALLNKRMGIQSDRQHIQDLKENEMLKRLYLDHMKEPQIRDLMGYLNEDPIINVTRPNDQFWDGRLQSVEDYRNIIEFIYRARNNLFHGHKRLDYERDLEIIQYGYKFLRPLMEIILNQENIDILQSNINNNTEFKELKCPYCSKKPKTEQGLRQHIKMKHPKEKSK